MKLFFNTLICLMISATSFADLSGNLRTLLQTDDAAVAAQATQDIAKEVTDFQRDSKGDSEELAQEIIRFGSLNDAQKRRVIGLINAVEAEATKRRHSRMKKVGIGGGVVGAVGGAAFSFIGLELYNSLGGAKTSVLTHVVSGAIFGAAFGAVGAGLGAFTQVGTYKLDSSLETVEKSLK